MSETVEAREFKVSPMSNVSISKCGRIHYQIRLVEGEILSDSEIKTLKLSGGAASPASKNDAIQETYLVALRYT